jgi:hypothetical protein
MFDLRLEKSLDLFQMTSYQSRGYNLADRFDYIGGTFLKDPGCSMRPDSKLYIRQDTTQ